MAETGVALKMKSALFICTCSKLQARIIYGHKYALGTETKRRDNPIAHAANPPRLRKASRPISATQPNLRISYRLSTNKMCIATNARIINAAARTPRLKTAGQLWETSERDAAYLSYTDYLKTSEVASSRLHGLQTDSAVKV